jgi:phage gp29-like protein
MAILDQWGNPIQQQVLDEPQTSRLGQLYREYALHPSRGLTPAKLASIFTQAERGHLVAQSDLFQDMEEKDGHIFSEMDKRKRAVLSIDWDITPPRNASAAEKAQAAWVKEILLDLPDFQSILLDMMDALGHGYSCSEIEWQMLGKERLPKAICHRPPSWFQVALDDQDKLMLRNASSEGEELWSFGWIKHIQKAKSGYLPRAGLHRVLAWPFLFKNYSVRDLAEFLEIYGLPLRLGKYPPGASDKEKATLLRAVMGIGHDAAGIIPQGMEIDFKDAAKGQHDPFQAMIDWCERTQSKVIVGQTLSSEARATGMGSGVATLHADVRDDLKRADALALGNTLTEQLIYPIIAINKGAQDPRRCPRFTFDLYEAEDLTSFADSVPKLVSIGMKIPERYAHEKLRIPMPEGDEPVLAPMAAPAAAPAGSGAPVLPAPDPKASATSQHLGAAIAALKGLQESQPDALDHYTEAMAAMADKGFDVLIAPIKKLVDEVADGGGTLAQLRDRLIETYGEMDAEPLANVLGLALSVAAAAGRYEVINGL